MTLTFRENMKYTLFMSLAFSLNLNAAIFQPQVFCDLKKMSANCAISNSSTKVMSCEFLVVGETIKGELITSTKIDMVLPFERQEVLITIKGVWDHLVFVNGEATCKNL